MLCNILSENLIYSISDNMKMVHGLIPLHKKTEIQ